MCEKMIGRNNLGRIRQRYAFGPILSWMTVVIAAAVAATSTNKASDIVRADYGVDVSFPMHYTQTRNFEIMGNKTKEYNDFLDSCVKFFDDLEKKKKKKGRGGDMCLEFEHDRIAMNLRQPKSMQNYTTLGFTKIRTPAGIWDKIQRFWQDNRHQQSVEQWGTGNTYTNNWISPSNVVNVENVKLRGGGKKLKQELWDMARHTIQEWTGQELTECSLYGIRIYRRGAILSTHVDRLPLVSSAIINVASDVEEPWPLEVVGHDGYAYNVTMEPGDMVLYESHSVLHGRPFPLKGEYVANIFIHFEPTGHSIRHDAKMKKQAADDYKKHAKEGRGGHENKEIAPLPPYIIEGSEEEANWREEHAHEEEEGFRSGTGSTIAHRAAMDGHMEKLQMALQKNPKLLHAKDVNGWQPIHEAVRTGNVEMVSFMHKKGADINARTRPDDKGGTVLFWAIEFLGKEHPMVDFLKNAGAEYIEPEL